MALIDFITPEEILARRRAELQEVIRGSDNPLQTVLATRLGQAGANLINRALGFDGDPELDQARASADVVEELRQGDFDSGDPDSLLDAARRFRAIGNLDQATKLIDRAREIRAEGRQVAREEAQLTAQVLSNIEKQADIDFAAATRDERTAKVLSDLGISQENFRRLRLENERLQRGLTARPTAPTPAKPETVDKDFQVSVDAVIDRRMQDAGVELTDEPDVEKRLNQIRSRARDIKNLPGNEELTIEQATEQAFDDLLEATNVGGFMKFFGADAFKARKDVTPVTREQATQPPRRVRLTLPE